jgi:hypothetical protein
MSEEWYAVMVMICETNEGSLNGTVEGRYDDQFRFEHRCFCSLMGCLLSSLVGEG